MVRFESRGVKEVLSVLSLTYFIFSQVHFSELDFTALRGALMIATMKQCSFAFDASTDVSIDKIFAFIFNPASLIFGPFVTFEQFKNSLNRIANGNFKVSIYLIKYTYF